MPIYKGTSEITSGNFYKGSIDIENGYKQTDSFFVNLITIQFTSISGLGYTYTLPTSRTGDPGTSYPSTTFTISGTAGQRLIASSFAMTNLPASLSATVTSGNNSQTLTVTITGNYPTVGVAPITSVVSGITDVTQYNAHYLVVAAGANNGGNYTMGGSGAGGLKTSFSTQGGGIAAASQLTLIPNTTYTVTVGQPSAGSSVFHNITATGGTQGSGQSYSNAYGIGGTAGSFGYGSASPPITYASGGGGAGSAGGNSFGGNGLQVLIKGGGSSPEYSHGGTGYAYNRGGAGSNPSSGEYGSGANGAGGSGIQGVVIIRVPTASIGTASGTRTSGTTGTDTWIQWTGSGTYTA